MVFALIATRAAAAARPAAQDAPKRILVVSSFSRDFSPYNELGSTFKTDLAERWKGPLAFVDVSIEAVSLGVVDEAPVVDYVRALCASGSFDLVVPIGWPAIQFWLRERERILPAAPTLLGAVEERFLANVSLGPRDGAAPIRIDLESLPATVLRLLPDTTDIVVVLGDSPNERFWRRRLVELWKPFEGRLRVTFTCDLSFEEVLRRAAELPPRTVLFFGMMVRDADGVPHGHVEAMDRLQAVANAPVFTWSDNLLGHGVVGGSLVPIAETGKSVARVAEGLLRGQPAPGGPAGDVVASRFVFDGRQLRRWHIPESRLPEGSEVRNRPPSFFVQYRWRILGALALIVAQTVVIVLLVLARRRQRVAKREALALRGELAHAGRVSVVGQLSSSLAHELSQPLGAIIRNAEAGELLLGADPPNLAEVREILGDIRSDGHRAGDVIDRMRRLLRRRELKLESLVVEELVEQVVALVHPDARARRVRLDVDVERDLPRVLGDQVHLQQVLLNLLVNGIDAMEPGPAEEKVLSVAARRGGPLTVEITVADTGPGIPPAVLPRLFEPFFTTKERGLGMGLPISRTIVEAHGGTIGAENPPGGGALIRLTLPAEEAGG